MKSLSIVTGLLGCIGVFACGDVITLAPDAGVEAGVDAAPDAAPAADSGSDVAAPVDAAHDAGVDVRDAPPTLGTSYFRVAHVSPDASAFDLCLSVPDSAADFTKSTPLFAATSPSGVSFSQVTTFMAADPATYGVRFVAPGGGCSQALTGLADAKLTLPPQAYATVVVRGSVAAGGFGARVAVDDPITGANKLGDAGPGALLRVLHEAAGVGALDLGKGTLASGNFVAMFSNLAYDANPTAGGSIDANGYLFPTLVQTDTVSVHLDGQTQDLASWAQLVIGYDDVATMFIVPPATGTAVRAVLCTRDYAQPAAGGVLNPTCALLTH